MAKKMATLRLCSIFYVYSNLISTEDHSMLFMQHTHTHTYALLFQSKTPQTLTARAVLQRTDSRVYIAQYFDLPSSASGRLLLGLRKQ